MALTSTGSDVALSYNANNGRYDLVFDTTGSNTGNPRFVDDQSHVVLSLLLERKGEWFADTSGKRGSLIHTVKVDTRIAASKIQAYAEDALQPLVDARRISNVSVSVTRKVPGRIELYVQYQTPEGEAKTVKTGLTY